LPTKLIDEWVSQRTAWTAGWKLVVQREIRLASNSDNQLNIIGFGGGAVIPQSRDFARPN
jgi:hypothetical protein